jgi:nitronate monooxygenase
VIPAATNKNLLNAQIDLCIKMQVPAVCLFWDVDSAIVQRLKAADILVLHQIGSLQDAELALKAGTDVLLAQGWEAGGHVRGLRSTLTLVADLVSATDVPVVACGGIATGAALISALAVGAQAVCCGTAFLTCHEANAHPHHQQRICQANGDETIHTTRFFRNWPMAAPVRVLPNGVTRGHFDSCGNQEVVTIGHQDDLPVHLFSTDSPLRDATGNVDAMALYAGQSCGQIHSVVSAAERIDVMISEALTAIEHCS